MNKYIDAEKLIAEIERLKSVLTDPLCSQRNILGPDWVAGGNKMLNEISSFITTLQQQPAEWSEDNIKELTEFEAAMLHIGMSFFGGFAGLNPNNTNEVKEQAKLLLQLATKQEWSEKNSPYYDNICEILINLLHSETADVNKDAVQKDLDWLNSLRPSWKPSKEQLSALKEQTSWLSKPNPLHSLYHQLCEL